MTRLTGLSADLIRAWEKRYGVVSPVRGPRGARLYTAADVEHLRLLARVVGAGRAIGDVAGLNRKALEALAHSGHARAPEPARDPIVGGLLAALERFDVDAVDRQLGEAFVALGGAAFVQNVAAPLLREVGEGWSQKRLSVADEHLMSGMIRNLLTGLIRARWKPAQPRVLLATPSGERHEFGLLLVGVHVVDAGLGLYYLGADLPAAEVVAAARRADAAVVGLGLVLTTNRARASAEVRVIEKGLSPGVELWLGGRDARAVAREVGRSRAAVMDDLVTLGAALTRIRAATVWQG